MARPLIRTENIEVTYNLGKSNEFKALREVNIEIYQGEYIILFGTSGSGKSTLMYNILGSLPPSAGRLFVEDEDVYSYSSKEMVRYQQEIVGIMFQKFNLIPSLNVIDNVALPQVFASNSLEKRRNKAQMLLDRFGVGETSYKLPSNLSGGQQQRISVARSLVNDPKILLADEPVGNLDSKSAKQVMDTIEDINKNDNTTIILVTHDAKHLPYAHRIYYIGDGKVLRDVPNPEKKQIKKGGQKSIVSEIEKLARLNPYDPVISLRVKSLVNYLTQDLDFEQIDTLQNAVQQFIEGKVSEDAFYKVLKTKMQKGGVGLTPSVAKMMTDKVATVLDQSRDVARYRKNTGQQPDEYLYKYVRRVREHVLEEQKLDLSDSQKKLLDQLLETRLSGLIRRDRFEETLSSKRSTIGGVGLGKRQSRDLTRYIEKLIAQGVIIEFKASH